MKKLWNIIIVLEMCIFFTYTSLMALAYFNIFPPVLVSFFGLVFFFGPFSELVVFPIYLFLKIAFPKYLPKRTWLFFMFMVIFFVLKISVYILILYSIIPLKSS